MRSTFKTLFYINRQKTKANGLTSILCRITIDGKNSVITTNEECKPAEWNIKQGPTTDKKINLRLQSFRELVEKMFRDSNLNYALKYAKRAHRLDPNLDDATKILTFFHIIRVAADSSDDCIRLFR